MFDTVMSKLRYFNTFTSHPTTGNRFEQPSCSESIQIRQFSFGFDNFNINYVLCVDDKMNWGCMVQVEFLWSSQSKSFTRHLAP